MNFMIALLVLICLAVGGTAGYFIGASKIVELQTRVDRVIAAGTENSDDVAVTEIAIKQALALKKEEYLKKETEFRKQHETEQQELKALLSNSVKRGIVLNDEKRRVNKNLEIVMQQMASAKWSSRNDLQKLREELVRKSKSLSEQADGLACLNQKVPIREISKLKKSKG